MGAMGDMFYRMAARYALSLVLEPAQRMLRPHQFAVGAEDGCTQVVHSLQHLLSTTTNYRIAYQAVDNRRG